jgi:3-methyladenine DNA glycosylase/8-oxoguanine DNA glycosylase
MHKPSHFPAPLDCFEDGLFWFTLRLGDKVYGVRLGPEVRRKAGIPLQVYARQPVAGALLASLEREIGHRFGMDLELTGFLKAVSDDPVLAPVARRWSGMRPSCAFSLYELLCISIVLQNAQVGRSVKMLQSLLGRYGSLIRFGGKEMYAFWAPSALAATSEEELRQLKVGYRAKAFLRVSRFFEDHAEFEAELRSLPKDVAGKRLREIYGVGPATSWYLLFESLKHLDAFDHVSPWEQKILSRLMFRKELVPAEEILAEAKKRWGQWRMLAVHYLFEDLFWRRRHEPVDWLEPLIRL